MLLCTFFVPFACFCLCSDSVVNRCVGCFGIRIRNNNKPGGGMLMMMNDVFWVVTISKMYRQLDAASNNTMFISAAHRNAQIVRLFSFHKSKYWDTHSYLSFCVLWCDALMKHNNHFGRTLTHSHSYHPWHGEVGRKGTHSLPFSHISDNGSVITIAFDVPFKHRNIAFCSMFHFNGSPNINIHSHT